MKYISRLTALLLAMMMIVSSAGAVEISLTQGQLDALYQAVSGECEYEYVVANTLGYGVELSLADGAALAARGYTFQWYQLIENADGDVHQTIDGALSYSYETVYPLDEECYYCLYVDKDGNESMSKVFVLSADTEDMEAYLSTLYTDFDNMVYVDERPIGEYAAAAYKWVQSVWNVTLSDGSNLARNVLDYWYAERNTDYFEPALLCSCVASGKVAVDGCLIAPDAEHDPSCGWYSGSPVLELAEGIDAEGNICYMLSMADDAGERVIIAMTEMLDGIHHYFKDTKSGLFVAWLYTDEEGGQWIIPLKSEKDLTGEDNAN